VNFKGLDKAQLYQAGANNVTGLFLEALCLVRAISYGDHRVRSAEASCTIRSITSRGRALLIRSACAQSLPAAAMSPLSVPSNIRSLLLPIVLSILHLFGVNDANCFFSASSRFRVASDDVRRPLISQTHAGRARSQTHCTRIRRTSSA
jgi:hypothetical protein